MRYLQTLLLSCLAGNGLLACSDNDATQLFAPADTGRASIALESGEDALLSVEYELTDRDGRIVLADTVEVEGGRAVAFTLDLPAAHGYSITLNARTRSGRLCSGSGQFDLAAGARVEVALTLECQPREEPRGQARVTAQLEPEPAPADPEACADLGGACHVVDPGDGPLHDCHQLGHAGEVAACAEQRASCVETCGAALCEALGALCHDVDPGAGPLHDCHVLGHTGDAAACFARGRECHELCTQAHLQPVVIEFEARLGEATLACGQPYADAGSPPAPVELRDFRFFVHDVALVTSDGQRVPVELDTRAPFQALGVALLDFEDGTGGCLSGDAATNAQVTGRAPAGDYTGLAFRLGVPEALNHADPAAQPPPLAAGSLSWGWLSGYKFLRAELGSATGSAALHLGSTACSGDPREGTVTCGRSHRAEVVLAGFDAATDRVIADLGALFGDLDLSQTSACHSSGAACASLLERLGLDAGTGASTRPESVFRIAE